MNQEEIRTFLALDLPEDVTCFLGNISNRLKQSRADVRWVNPTSIHLTLKFLGNIIDAQIPDIETALRPVLSSQSPVQIEISDIGAFPNLRQPRVVWVGVSDTSGRLVKMVSLIEDAFDRVGFQRESRSFNPHLTLGRTKSNRDKERLVDLINSMNPTPSITFVADRATLFQSILEPAGSRYKVLSVFYLSHPAAAESLGNELKITPIS
ncbi:MAG: RNA 2',3'-cyclic phosphodiesterase [Desulfomonilaceae bacterium]